MSTIRILTASRLLVAVSLGVATAAAADEVPWGYEGTLGPEHWALLSPDFASCNGSFQSPIDIVDPTEAELGPIAIVQDGSTSTIQNNGHTLQVDVSPGSTLEIGGRTYDLVQVHFHSPSEHRIAGRSFPMEAHFVHRHPRGELAVLAVLFDEGAHNARLAELGKVAPQEIGASAPIELPVADLGLLPDDWTYYRYVGSLTTPPCTEGILWLVLEAKASVSGEQVERFVNLIGKDNRPIQPLNGRLILR
jgi:carbonic anhydrase